MKKPRQPISSPKVVVAALITSIVSNNIIAMIAIDVGSSFYFFGKYNFIFSISTSSKCPILLSSFVIKCK